MLRTEKMWPHVSSPLARRVLSAAANNKNTVLALGDDDYLLDPMQGIPISPDTLEYQQWLESKLANSNIELMVPAGLDLLPDIYSAMPKLIGNFTKVFKPRNYEQLVDHLIKHLEWYVEPTQYYFAGFDQLFTQLRRLVQIMFAVGILYVFLVGSVTTGLIAVAVGLPVIFLMGYLTNQIYPSQVKFGLSPEKQLVNANLLYRYLRHAYTDKEEASW